MLLPAVLAWVASWQLHHALKDSAHAAEDSSSFVALAPICSGAVRSVPVGGSMPYRMRNSQPRR